MTRSTGLGGASSPTGGRQLQNGLLMEQTYRLSPGCEVLDLDTSLPTKPLLVILGNKHLQVSGVAKEVLVCLGKQRAKENHVATLLSLNAMAPPPSEQLHMALRALAEAGIVQTAPGTSSDESDNGAKSSSARGYFLFRIPLLSERMIRPITSRLAPLFHDKYVAWLLPILLLVHIILSCLFFGKFRGLLSSLQRSDYFLLLVGNYLALLLHEVGHASACVKGGVRHGPIGFGLYLVFPTFFADVTDAWRLPRRQRVVVDAGGIYMSLLAATATAMLYLFTHQPVYAVLTAVYHTTVWVSLWPFIRMDGYWIISDALGVPNLMTANRQLTTWFLHRLRGRARPRPHVLSIEPRRLRTLYLWYYLGSTISVFYVLFRLCRSYVPFVVRSVPFILRDAILQIEVGGLCFHTLKSLIRVLVTVVPLVSISAYVVRWVSRLSKMAFVHTTQGQNE